MAKFTQGLKKMVGVGVVAIAIWHISLNYFVKKTPADLKTRKEE